MVNIYLSTILTRLQRVRDCFLATTYYNIVSTSEEGHNIIVSYHINTYNVLFLLKCRGNTI